jgi:pyrophosphatase PpaX
MARLALLFDLDGTLIDSIDLLVDCMDHAFVGRARSPTRDQWVAGIGTPLRQQLAEWADDDAVVEMLLTRYRTYQDLHLERRTSLYPGVRELFAWARSRGHALGLVTSKGKGMTERSLRHVGLADAFDVKVTVESTTRHKPHPDPVIHALTSLGIPSNLAIFAGDSPHDMHAGREAAVSTAACLWGPFSREQLSIANPAYWVRSVPELQQVIEEYERSNLQRSRPVKSGDLDGTHVRSSGDHANS